MNDKELNEHEGSRLHTPDEWSVVDGVTVMDPDGWRFRVRVSESEDYLPRPWGDRITRQEWDARVGVSSTSRKRRSTEVQRWADTAMFRSEPLDATTGPKVHLLHMNNDPLGAIAAFALMYKGIVVRDLADVTDEQRREMFEQIKQTRLKAPFEAVSLHWMVEGVTRSLTHQMVRQRTAVFAQESLRFAVVEDDFTDRVALPPSLVGTEGMWRHYEGEALSLLAPADAGDPAVDRYVSERMARETEEEKKRWAWDQALSKVEAQYSYLVESGMPAEDARGLLPHNITTRLNYKTDLRNFAEQAGSRLCTQAQFEWRALWIAFVQELRRYGRTITYTVNEASRPGGVKLPVFKSSCWQFDLIAELFRPACYLTGKCEFAAMDLDRKCSIRNRVDANHEIGRQPSEWGSEHDVVEDGPIVSGVGPKSVVRNEGGEPVFIGAIDPREWLADPGAAR